MSRHGAPAVAAARGSARSCSSAIRLRRSAAAAALEQPRRACGADARRSDRARCARRSPRELRRALSALLRRTCPRPRPASPRRRAGRRRSTSSSTPATASCAAPRSRASLTADERREILRGMVADARHRQPAEGVLHRRRRPLRRRDVPGQGLPIARTGSDLRRRDPAAPRRRPIATRRTAGAATSSRR